MVYMSKATLIAIESVACDIVPEVAKAIAEHSTLQTLFLRCTQLSLFTCVVLFTKVLDIEGMQAIAKALPFAQNLCTLHLECMDMDCSLSLSRLFHDLGIKMESEGVIAIAEALPRSQLHILLLICSDVFPCDAVKS